jgi:hypothetical protein
MMKNFTRLFGVVAVLGIGSLAHANYVIGYDLNGGGPTLCQNSASDNVASCFAVPTSIGGGVTITNMSGTSNSPGAPSFSNQAGSTTTISTTGSSAVLTIWFAAQDFSQPVTPPAIQYASNYSITTFQPGSSGSVALTSCVDQSNGTVPPVGTFCSSPAATLTNAGLTISGALGGSASNTVLGTIASLSAPFSLSQVVTLTLGANTSVNLITSQVLTPVPEPASLVLLGGVVLLVSSRLVRRKRNQGAQA